MQDLKVNIGLSKHKDRQLETMCTQVQPYTSDNGPKISGPSAKERKNIERVIANIAVLAISCSKIV
jgi:ribosomal protein S10